MTAKAQTFKDNFDLISYAKEHFDGELRGDKLFILCPFHSEATPSCMISNTGWHCFGACGCGGDSIDFVMRVTDLSFLDVVNNPELISKYAIKDNLSKQQTKPKKSNNISPALFVNYKRQLLRNKKKIQYLLDRGFDIKSIDDSNIGYGIPVDVFGWKFRHPRYVIPHFNNGKIVGVKYRIDPEYADYENEKYISHPGTNGVIYNIDMFTTQKRIIYVGSQFDAAVLWYRYKIPAVCPPSENTFKDEWIPLFIDKEILIWLDNDETGVNSSLNVYSKIKSVVNKADIFIWNNQYKRKDDFTDFLMREGIEKVITIYNNL